MSDDDDDEQAPVAVFGDESSAARAALGEHTTASAACAVATTLCALFRARGYSIDAYCKVARADVAIEAARVYDASDDADVDEFVRRALGIGERSAIDASPLARAATLRRVRVAGRDPATGARVVALVGDAYARTRRTLRARKALAVDAVPSVVEAAGGDGVGRLIVVAWREPATASAAVTPAVRAAFARAAPHAAVEFFARDELCYRVLEHALQPLAWARVDASPHERDPSRLQEMSVDDPVARFFAWPPGAIVRITRADAREGRIDEYRVVVDVERPMRAVAAAAKQPSTSKAARRAKATTTKTIVESPPRIDIDEVPPAR